MHNHDKLIDALRRLKRIYSDVNFTVEYDYFDDGDYYYSIYHDSEKLDKNHEFYDLFYKVIEESYPLQANIAILYGKPDSTELIIYDDIAMEKSLKALRKERILAKKIAKNISNEMRREASNHSNISEFSALAA